MIETAKGKKIYSEFEQGYLKALEDVLKIEKHTYKTYESGFMESRDAIFVGDVEHLKNQKLRG